MTPSKQEKKRTMNELEQQHIKKAAILNEKLDLLRNFQACIENTVQGVLSTIHSSDNANILSQQIRYRVDARCCHRKPVSRA